MRRAVAVVAVVGIVSMCAGCTSIPGLSAFVNQTGIDSSGVATTLKPISDTQTAILFNNGYGVVVPMPAGALAGINSGAAVAVEDSTITVKPVSETVIEIPPVTTPVPIPAQ
jgi:hypothetical protein